MRTLRACYNRKCRAAISLCCNDPGSAAQQLGHDGQSSGSRVARFDHGHFVRSCHIRIRTVTEQTCRGDLQQGASIWRRHINASTLPVRRFVSPYGECVGAPVIAWPGPGHVLPARIRAQPGLSGSHSLKSASSGGRSEPAKASARSCAIFGSLLLFRIRITPSHQSRTAHCGLTGRASLDWRPAVARLRRSRPTNQRRRLTARDCGLPPAQAAPARRP